MKPRAMQKEVPMPELKPCPICGARVRRPDRHGDEVRIREIVTGGDLDGDLYNVVYVGQILTLHMGISYEDALSGRMAEATARLGPWDVHDGRDYRREALEELLDAACYLAAEKMREEKACK